VKTPSRKTLIIGAGAIVAAGLVFALRSGGSEPRYVTAVVDRGDIADMVGATGTLQAVTTVQVGSQVSGTVSQLLADFNSRVQKDQVVARLDPSLFQARVEQAQANLVSARANVERQQATLEDARQKSDRAEALAKEGLLPASDLETARSTYQSAVAQLKANRAAVTQAVAGVNQAKVDLEHTIIRAPIDGIVVGRSVDVGQTVAASLQAPVLFVIAQDLSRMQVLASIDEADIGRVRTGQKATFRVDSFPDQVFEGRVEQVRLQPTTAQNVVTYSAIIAVDNPRQQLMPGMTATVSLVVRERSDVLRVPAAALRFRPPEGTVEASDRGGRVADAAPGAERGASPAGPGQAGAQDGSERRRWRGQGGGGGGGGRQWGGPRAEGGADAASPGAPASPGAGGAGAGGRAAADGSADRGRPAVVYAPGPKDKLQPRRIRTGLSDGQYAEVLSGLEEGAQVVTAVEGEARPGAARPSAAPTNNPFAPGRIQRRQR
jgi:HlyD family secretion protein